MKISQVEFLKSVEGPLDYPPADRPEIAFAGRSNVGKSSLLNTLVGRKKLARVSKTPGRTQLINYFDLNNGEMYLVDLPGYGYAQVSKKKKADWGPMIETYLDRRPNLMGLVCLMDIRRGAEEDDIQLIEAAPHFKVQPILVFTKADKLSKQKRESRRREIAENFGVSPEEIILFSTKERLGKRELWRRIEQLTGIG